MPIATLHRNGFEIDFAPKDPYKQLTLYEGEEVSSNGKRISREATKHTGGFSAVNSKAHISKAPVEPIKARLTLLPGLNFRSGNAVLFGLRIRTPGFRARRVDFTPILKDEHTRSRQNASTVFACAEVPMSQADEGTMSISVTRGNCDASMANFVPLVDADGTPYTVEVAWRWPEYGMSPQVAVTPEISAREQLAQITAESRKQNESAKPTQVPSATKPQASQDQESTSGPTTQPTIRTQDHSQASSSNGSELFTPPPDTDINFDKTPDLSQPPESAEDLQT
jgi:hypothetical protein